MKNSLFLVLQDVREEIQSQLQSFNQLITEEDRQEAPFALVVDGKALELCLDSEIMSSQFLSVALNCDVVICCRVSPKQKASVGKDPSSLHFSSSWCLTLLKHLRCS